MLMPGIDQTFHLTTPVSVLLVGAASSIGLATPASAGIWPSLWRGTSYALRFLLYDGVPAAALGADGGSCSSTGWCAGWGAIWCSRC
jgi:hypothetical protein